MDLTNLQNFIKSKWFPVAAIGLVFFLIILIALSSASKKTQPFPGAEPTLPPQQSIQSDTLITSSPSQSAEVQKAIEEQLKVDQDYASWQKEISDIYPWRKKLPLTSEKYYVYFDLEKKILHKLSILKEETLAIGDSSADKSMFKFAGKSVAINPKNGIEKFTDFVIDNNLSKTIPIIKKLNKIY